MAKIKEYTNGEVTVIWKPELCIHSGICVKGLPEVFRPKVRPWIRIKKASSEELIHQVKHCPSGALSYRLNEEEPEEELGPKTKVEVLENGPLLVHGLLQVIDDKGSAEVKTKTTVFCRCGASNNKPYCDGAHAKVNFEG